MKKNTAILALLLLSATLGFSQQTPEYKTSKMEQKVLNKIKRTMRACDYKDYIAEGQKASFMVTCHVNNENIIEVSDVVGKYKKLAEEITSTLEKHPVKCCSDRKGETFSFRLTFDYRPAS